MARDFSSPRFTRAGCFTTTQVPHFGQVTHEHAMRSAISGLYCSGNRPILPAIGSAEDHRLPSFATVRSRGGELADMLRVSGQDEARAVIAVGCLQLLCALNPVQDTKFCPFDGRSVRVYRTILSRSWNIPITFLRDSAWVLKSQLRSTLPGRRRRPPKDL
jgi:hypothetical protein